jgi:hypothetical protein
MKPSRYQSDIWQLFLFFMRRVQLASFENRKSGNLPSKDRRES